MNYCTAFVACDHFLEEFLVHMDAKFHFQTMLNHP